ncbi:hypothetical protein FOLKNPGA_00942 [Legionella sp. PC1000]|nr:hypothetical protein FOLKNPGA_00942 [Legionella sp. PC1000]
MGREKLINGLGQESTSLKKMAPPKIREGVSTAFLQSLSTQAMLDLKNEIINKKDDEKYIKLTLDSLYVIHTRLLPQSILSSHYS